MEVRYTFTSILAQLPQLNSRMPYKTIFLDFHHQIVFLLDSLILQSRLITGTPRYKAVAAIMRSGKSGTCVRSTKRKAWAICQSNGTSANTASVVSTTASSLSSVSAEIRPFSLK